MFEFKLIHPNYNYTLGIDLSYNITPELFFFFSKRGLNRIYRQVPFLAELDNSELFETNFFF